MRHEIGLEPDAVLRTELGKEVRGIKELGSGSRAIVYSVMYDGCQAALKWYRPNVFFDRQRVIEKLHSVIMSDKPSEAFLWPVDITTTDDSGSFGVVVELRPDGFVDLADAFSHPGIFPSRRRIIDACLGIVSAYSALHNKGFCVATGCLEGLIVNPRTGKILVQAEDEVVPIGTDPGTMGAFRFLAPEIVAKSSIPKVQSDRHSMSVLMFMLLCMHHPLEGVRLTSTSSLDPTMLKRYYGTDPIFVMDPDVHTNRPDPAWPNVLNIWPHLPDHMRSIFVRAFSRTALVNDPETRPSEIDWIRELTRFRSEVVNCTCDHEVFMEGASPVVCDNPRRGRTVRVPLRADLAEYSLPLAQDTRLYRHQTRVCDANAATEVDAWVVRHRQREDVLGVMNLSSEPWSVTIGDSTCVVAPGKTIMALPGMELTLNEGKVTIRLND